VQTTETRDRDHKVGTDCLEVKQKNNEAKNSMLSNELKKRVNMD
jgi:hypothetical protein